MKKVSEEKVRDEASVGKNNPLAKSTRVEQQQNGEVEPNRRDAQKQPGTDAARRNGR